MNFFAYIKALRFGGVAEDAIDYTDHDRRYHKGHFDPATMTCEMREAEAQGDLVDVLNAEEGEKALYWKKYWKEHPEEYAAREAARKARREAKRKARHRKSARKAAERTAHMDSVDKKTIKELESRAYTDADRKMSESGVNHVLTSPPVKVTMEEAQEVASNLRDKKSTMYDNMVNLFAKLYPKGVEVPVVGKVEINASSASSIMAHRRGGLKIYLLATLGVLDSLLKQGVCFCVNPRWKGRPMDSIGIVAPMRLDGRDKSVEMIVTRNTKGRLVLYHIGVCPKEEVEAGTRLGHLALSEIGEKNLTSTTAHSIPKAGGDVNRDITENSGTEKLPRSNLVRQYLAAHGLLDQYVTQ